MNLLCSYCESFLNFDWKLLALKGLDHNFHIKNYKYYQNLVDKLCFKKTNFNFHDPIL